MMKIVSERPLKNEATGRTNITLISGMAGICSVGRIVVDALVAQFNATLVASLYLDDLPAQVLIDGHGRMSLPSVQVYLARPVPTESFLLVTGEYQPSSNAGMFGFVDALLNYLIAEQGTRPSLIISTGAYVVDQVPEEPKVFVSGTDDAAIASFLSIDGSKMALMENGLISGANGIIPAWGLVVGIPGICMLAETVPVVKRDPRAAKLVIEMLGKRFGFPFDPAPMAKEIEDMAAVLAGLKRAQGGTGDAMEDARRDRQSYIG